MEPKKLLFVDDDSIVLDLFIKKFVKDNFRVNVAMSGGNAIDVIKKGFQPDVLIVDIKMPDMDGFEMIEKIREEHLVSTDVKIVMFSSMSEGPYIEKAKSMNVDGYIIKTADPSEMLSQVKEIIDGKKIFARAL